MYVAQHGVTMSDNDATQSPAETLIPVGDVDSIDEGGVRKICTPKAGPISVFRVEGELYAIADTCSHGMASLAEGWLEGFEIECPIHAGRFDIRDGKPLCFPLTAPVASYQTRVIDGQVYVVLSTAQNA
jgi:nitrite reductase/ring-hydroxylating ferredoxin subunit